MAITGAPDAAFKGEAGGSFSEGGPPLGVFHVEAREVTRGESKKNRAQLIFDLYVKDDPNNAAKEGKRLTKMFQSLASPEDDEDKQKTMRGMLKRTCYEGFGVKWPEAGSGVDPRQFQGKTAWVLIGEKVDDRDPQNPIKRKQVVAVAQEKDKLPKLHVEGAPPPAVKPARRR